ncbi:hypothetical protein ABTG45_04935 [Acinetobacter baumannii]|uniref:hypothetical protein n=1 Tax=Acinetobacter baumannii TaxID=470 RepID=UPI00234C99CD|nr:hypothetical protein [Acinetobacter baumannii]MDC7429284.1 hypothetical protein [Acinetobacter baumannii]MDC7466689.1 hypothetical protein [Acinetobacter baumannii]
MNKITLTLPQFELRKEKIHSNYVQQIGIKHLFKHIHGRNNKWQAEGASRFIKGDLTDLEKYRNMANTMPIRLEVTIVQPGLSKSAVTEEISKLLACTESYIKKTTKADLKVWCSV